MKKLLLSIAMLFSIAMHSHDLSDKLRGAWSSDKHKLLCCYITQRRYMVMN